MKKTKKQFAKVMVTFLLFILFGVMTAAADQDGDWEYSVKDEGACITGYLGKDREVNLPDQLGGYRVVALNDRVFKENATVESICIPENVSRIGDSAFYACEALTEVVLPESLTSIGNYAFAKSKIRSIKIPDTVTHIGYYAFKECTGLMTAEIGSGITEWKTEYGVNGAFTGCTLLSSVTLHDGLSAIGSEAFSGCTLLMEIRCPESILSIGDGAFADCELLDTAVLYGSIGKSAFKNCSNLKYVTLSNVESIGSSAFRNNTMLETIELPEMLANIGQSAFQACNKLKEIILPDSVAEVGAYAFKDCTQLGNVVIGAGLSSWDTEYGVSGAFENCPKLETAQVKDGAAYLGSELFCDDISLREIILPGSIVSINEKAFLNCSSLEKVVFNEGTETIGANAFRNCTVLSLADLPRSLRSVGDNAFRNTLLRRVDLGDKVRSVGYYAFADCPAIRTAAIGGGIEEWRTEYGINGAFLNDSRLETLTVKEGTLSIGSHCFENCSRLISCDIPITVTKVCDSAFKNCTSLMHISMLRGEIGTEAFCGCSALWDLQLSRITAIGSSAFRDNIALADLILPESVLSIGAKAFSGCVSLSQLTIPDSVTYLGEYAFSSCTGLLNVMIGNNITTWDTEYGVNGAFSGDVSLRYAILKDGANSIGNRVFSDCSSLIAVSLPESIVSWGENLFPGCPENMVIFTAGPKAEEKAREIEMKSVREELVIPQPAMFRLTILPSEHGTLCPAGDLSKPEGSDQIFTSVPEEGYILNAIYLDGKLFPMGEPLSDIQSDAEVTGEFLPDPAYVDEYPDPENLVSSSVEESAPSPENVQQGDSEEAGTAKDAPEDTAQNDTAENDTAQTKEGDPEETAEKVSANTISFAPPADPSKDLEIRLENASRTETQNIVSGTVTNHGTLSWADIILEAVFHDADGAELCRETVQLGADTVLTAEDSCAFEVAVSRDDAIATCTVTVRSAENR